MRQRMYMLLDMAALMMMPDTASTTGPGTNMRRERPMRTTAADWKQRGIHVRKLNAIRTTDMSWVVALLFPSERRTIGDE